MDKYVPFDLPAHVQVDLVSGDFSPYSETYERRLSQLAGLFSDQVAVRKTLEHADPLLYDVHSRPFITSLSDFTFGITRIFPGKVGSEYFMTKGHFHLLLEQPEIYLCLAGFGCLLFESGDGSFHSQWMKPGTVSHIPPGFAHRTVNSGAEPFVFASVYHLGAGHDYGSIAQHGFAKLVVEVDGKPQLVDNPKR